MSGSTSLGNLYVTMSAETTAFLKGMASAAASVEQVSKHMKKAAREVAQVGAAFAAVGTGILANAAQWDKGVERSMEALSKSFGAVSVEASRLLLPAVREVTKWMKTLADYIAGLTPHQREMILTWAKWGAAIAVVAAGIAFVAPLVGALAATLGALASVAAAISAPMLAGVAAIAVGVIFLHKVWRESWGGIQEKTQAVISAISGAWADFKNWIVGIFSDILKSYTEITAGIGLATVKVLEVTGKISKQQADIMRGTIESAKNLAQNGGLAAGLKTAALQFGATVKDEILTGIGGMTEEAQRMFADLMKQAGKLGAAFKKGHASNDIYDHDIVQSVRNQAGRGLTVDATTGSMRILSASDRTARQMTAGSNNASAADQAASKAANEWIHASGMVARPTFLAVADFFTRGGRETYQKILDGGGTIEEAENAAAASVRSAAEGIHAAMGSAVNSLTSKLGDAGDVLNGAMQGMAQGGPMGAIVGALAAVVMKLEAFGRVGDSMNKFLGKFLKMIDGVIGPLIDQFVMMSESLSTITEVAFKASGALEVIGFSLFVLGKVIDIVSLAFLGVAKFFADMVGGNKDINDKMKDTLYDLNKGYHQMDTPPPPLPTSQLDALGDAATRTANAFGEMLTNIPAGYKMLHARQFGADSGMGGWALPGSTGAGKPGTHGSDSGGANSPAAAGAAGLTPELAAMWTRVFNAGIINGMSTEGAAAAADAYVASHKNGTAGAGWGSGSGGENPNAAPPPGQASAPGSIDAAIHIHGGLTVQARTPMEFHAAVVAAARSRDKRTYRNGYQPK